MERKTLKFEVKQVDEETGIFEGYAATFSKELDSYGDLIEPGAFTRTLEQGGKRIKILWQHDVREPIGKPISVTEDEKGLLVKGKLSLGVQRAREILSLMKDGVVTELSIGYDAITAPIISGVRHLKEVRLWDISPCVFAANPEAVIMGVKTAATREPLEGKPYPNEHACRLNPPSKYDEFRRGKRESDGKEYSIIFGKLKDEQTWEEQAYRYAKDVWDVDEARSHCEKHDGNFEAASKALLISTGTELTSDGKELAKGETDPEKSTLLSLEATELEVALGKIKAENAGFDAIQAERRIDAFLNELRSK